MEEGLSFSSYSNMSELARVGSLCKMSTTPQSLLNNTRYLVTLEGRDKIRILREAADSEFLEYIEKAKDDKLRDLKERVDNLATLRLHNQTSDTTVENLRMYLPPYAASSKELKKVKSTKMRCWNTITRAK